MKIIYLFKYTYFQFFVFLFTTFFCFKSWEKNYCVELCIFKNLLFIILMWLSENAQLMHHSNFVFNIKYVQLSNMNCCSYNSFAIFSGLPRTKSARFSFWLFRKKKVSALLNIGVFYIDLKWINLLTASFESNCEML